MKIITLFICICLSACNVSKNAAADSVQKSKAPLSVCDQAIKYSGEIPEQEKDDDEKDISRVAIIVNPAKKLVSIIVQDSIKIFDMEIVSVTCNLNSDLSQGEAVYQGLIIQRDGSRTPSTFKLKAENGAFVMLTPELEKLGRIAISMQKWEKL